MCAHVCACFFGGVFSCACSHFRPSLLDISVNLTPAGSEVNLLAIFEKETLPWMRQPPLHWMRAHTCSLLLLTPELQHNVAFGAAQPMECVYTHICVSVANEMQAVCR